MIKRISKLIDINADWNNGTLTDVVAVNDGLELKNDYALSFDGVNDYVKLSNSNTTFTDFELEINAELYRSTAIQMIIGIFEPSVDATNYSIGLFITSDDNLNFVCRSPSGSYQVITFNYSSFGEIKKINAKKNGNTLELYVDDVLEASATFTDFITTFDDIYLGKNVDENSFDYFADCLIKNAKISLDNTTFLDWEMNEGTGTTLTDYAGSNDGTINGATWINSYLPTGNRLSPTIDLSTVGTVDTSTISWAETLNGETITIETSVDGGSTWQTATNGSSILNLTDIDTTLDIKQTLSTADTAVTPRLLDLYWEVISSDTDITNIKGNIYWDSRSSPIFKEGIDSIIKVKFLPAKWRKAIEIINQWQTEAKPTSNWQSETKPNNIWEG